MSSEYKLEIRKQDAEIRRKNVALYELNIENYEAAAKICRENGNDEFLKELLKRIEDEQTQLDREQTMLDAVEGFLNVCES